MASSELFNLLIKMLFIFIAILAAVSLPVLLPLFKNHKLNEIKNSTTVRKLTCNVFISYVCVILYCTLIYKGYAHYDLKINFLPFYTYRQAWNSFSAWSWQLILFNILLFIPYGFILPSVFNNKWMNRWWAVLLSGIMFSTIIELAQRRFNVGYFDIDDIINNTFGILIGYSVYKTVTAIRQKRKYPFLSIIPSLVIIGSFACLFLVYYTQPYGNLPCNYVYKVNMSDAEVISSVHSNGNAKSAIYKASFGSNDAAAILSQYGINTQEAEIYDYADETHYIIRIPKYKSIIIYKNENAYEYYTSPSNESYNNQYPADKVKEILSRLNITIPEGFDFFIENEHTYVFRGFVINDNVLISGTVKCRINDNEELIYLYDSILQSLKHSEIDILSVDEGIERIKDGKFHLDIDEKIEKVDITDYTIGYKPDTKGYMQPVYLFNTIINSKTKYDIIIPALKSPV
jgi:glycopeptide antibiotics resistance protein